jgi:hypothetical protein
MHSEISPKVLNPMIGLAGLGGVLTAAATAVSDRRLAGLGVTLLGASVAVGALGWLSTDPQREPWIEPGFEEPVPEPEVEEHRAREREQADGAPAGSGTPQAG